MSSDLSGELPTDSKSDSLADLRDAGFDVILGQEQLFMSHTEWMQRTHRTFGVRSSELRRLDDAIARAEYISDELNNLEDELEDRFHGGYLSDKVDKLREQKEKEAYRIVRNAFDAWAKSEGEWETGGRNRNLAPSKIYLRLLDLQDRYPDLVPDSAAIVTAGSEFTAELFRGATVTLRGADVENLVNSVSQMSTITSVPGQVGEMHNAMHDLIAPHFGDSIQHVATKDPALARELSKLIPGMAINAHTIMSLVPALNVVATTVSALNKFYDVYQTDLQRTQLLRVSRAVPEGDAKTALGVIKDWQDQYILEIKAAACVDAGIAGLQLLGALVPGTLPAAALAGAAKSFAAAMAVVAELGAQYRESQKLEAYLRRAEGIDTSIFSICPLVGAYYVLNVPFSVFSLHLIPFESPTFFGETENLRESGEMKAVMVGAERILDASKYILSKDGKPFRSRESMSIENQMRGYARNLKRRWAA